MAEPLDPADFGADSATLPQDFPDSAFEEEAFSPSIEGVNAEDNLSDVQASEAWYPENTVDLRYDYYPGVAVQVDAGQGDPLAGRPSNSGRPVKKHEGFWTKVVEWTFERLNDWPLCPHPLSGNADEVLIECAIVPAKPLELPGGGRAYRVSGRYVYHLLSGFTGCGPFPTATSEESTASQSDNTAPQVIFDPTLLASFTP